MYDFKDMKYMVDAKEKYLETLLKAKDECLMSYRRIKTDDSKEVEEFKALQIAYFNNQIEECQSDIIRWRKELLKSGKGIENKIVKLFS